MMPTSQEGNKRQNAFQDDPEAKADACLGMLDMTNCSN